MKGALPPGDTVPMKGTLVPAGGPPATKYLWRA